MLQVSIYKQLSHCPIDVTFCAENEIIALTGPSGSGKTTILEAIAGLTKLDKGSIIVKERTFAADGKSLIPVQRRQVGYVFQDYALFPHKTVWENIAYGMKHESFTKQMIEDLAMKQLINQYPHEISGGEKQRTALIRAFATEPDVLLLDEPFAALDEQTKTKNYEQLLQLHQKWQIPVVFVSHNREEVERLASRVYTIQEGKFTMKALSSEENVTINEID